MNSVTVLTCSGWSAVYGPEGQRVGTFLSVEIASLLRSIGVDVTERPLAVDARFIDFPRELKQ